MLTDSEVVSLQRDAEYRRLAHLGLKSLVTDILKEGKGDLKPNVATLAKITRGFMRARLIRNEMFQVRRELMERFLNRDLNWLREPRSVRTICESSQDFLWMRYDEMRVQALFDSSEMLITHAAFRDLIKNLSSLPDATKNPRLRELLRELRQLRETTLRSINADQMNRFLYKIVSSDWFNKNADRVKDEIMESATRGYLGSAPQTPPLPLPPPSSLTTTRSDEGQIENPESAT